MQSAGALKYNLDDWTSVRRMDLAGNAPAELLRSQFQEGWTGIENRKYAIDVDSGIMHAANLAGNWIEEHGDEMRQLFDLSGLD